MKVLRRLLPVVLGLLLVAGGAALGLLHGPTVDYDGLFGDSRQTCAAPFLFREQAPTQADIAEAERELEGLGRSAENRYRSCADAVGPLRIGAAALILAGLVVVVGALVLGRRRRRRAAAVPPGPVGPQSPRIGTPPPPQRTPVAPR